MPIIKWIPTPDPFEGFDKLFGEGISAIIPRAFTPSADVYQTKDKIKIEIPLAGIDPEDVEISIGNDVMVVSGSTEKKTEVDEKDYFRHEVRSGSFYRSIPLPARVSRDKAEAIYENGILTISVPKVSQPKAKIIKIKNIKSKVVKKK